MLSYLDVFFKMLKHFYFHIYSVTLCDTRTKLFDTANLSNHVRLDSRESGLKYLNRVGAYH